MPAMALLDNDGVYGAPRFHMAAKKVGIRAHIGAEVTATDGCRYPLLAQSRTGYQNLCRLVTKMKLRSPKGEGAVAPEEIAEYAKGLICLAGVEGGPPLETAFLIFGKDHVYAEVQRHMDRREEFRNQATIALGSRLKIPLLATNGVCHARLEQRELMDALTCVREKLRIEDAGRLLTKNNERYLKHAREMEALFADLPHAIGNTLEL